MADVAILQMPAFKRVYKKLAANHQSVVDDAVRAIIANPAIGEAKKGDLAGVYVHKFPLKRQQMLLAYEWDPKTRVLLLLGSHENFYRNLKRG
jgi:mRNA-degrading endonuclease RelE of RelBE toxin-antitoxin system